MVNGSKKPRFWWCLNRILLYTRETHPPNVCAFITPCTHTHTQGTTHKVQVALSAQCTACSMPQVVRSALRMWRKVHSPSPK